MVFNSLFAIGYIYSQSPKYKVSQEFYSGKGKIDNIFYPVEDENDNEEKNIIIHEYKFSSDV